MPELPEVETVRVKLKERLINKKINDVNVLWNNMIVDIHPNDFRDKLKGQIFYDIKRRGKWLIFELDNDCLLVHLRMEGKFFLKEIDSDLNKHEHVIFKLDDIELRFHDVRKFGKMYLLNKHELNHKKPLKELGLEPFDEKLTISYLKNKYKNKNIPVKQILLDQSIITGIGNIYADEILFLSNINPYTKSNELKKKDLEEIINNTRIILGNAIKQGGTTIRSYISLDDQKGTYQNELMVHMRNNLPCRICNSKIKKETIAGRGTYYCPTCQK